MSDDDPEQQPSPPQPQPQPSEFVRQVDPHLAHHMAQQWRLHVRQGVEQKKLPYPLPPPRPGGAARIGGSVRFTHEERNARLVRVEVSDAARQFLLIGHKESRLLPQALSETFGLLAVDYHLPISHVALDMVSRVALVADAGVETDASVLALPESGLYAQALEIVVHHTADSAYADHPHRMLMVSHIWHALNPVTRDPVLKAHTASLHHAHHYLARHPAGQTIPEPLR